MRAAISTESIGREGFYRATAKDETAISSESMGEEGAIELNVQNKR